MSQMKIWKIVKESRAKRDAERLKDEERRDQQEQAVGQTIEENNGRDRAKWEAMYGGKELGEVHVDSGVGSSINSDPKRSTSVNERALSFVEMSSLASKRGSKRASGPQVSVRTTSDDGIAQNKAYPPSQRNLLSYDQSGAPSIVSAQERSELEDSNPASTADFNDTTSIKDWSLHRSRSPVEPEPKITPLPFSIPSEEPEQDDGDCQSVGTAGLSVLGRRMPLKALTLKKKQDEDESAGLSPIRSNRASSIAAIADEDVAMDALSQHRLSQAPPLPQTLGLSQESLRPSSVVDEDSSSSDNPRRSFIEAPVEEEDLEIIVRPPTALDEAPPQIARVVSQSRHGRGSSHAHPAAAESSIGDPVNVRDVGNLKEHLPEPMSKVAKIYRTNEWAKHAADASEPEPVSDAESSSPGVQVDPIFQDEAAKAAEEVHKPTANVSAPSRNASASSNNSYRRSIQPSPAPALSRSASATVTPVYAFKRSSSQASLQKQDSRSMASPKLARINSRNFSAPLSSQRLAETPIEEEPAQDVSRNASSTLDLATQSNLMDQRNDRLKRKTTTISFNSLAVSDANLAGQSATSPLQASGVEDTPEDEMTLAQRRLVIQQRRASQQAEQQRRNIIQALPSVQPRSNSRQRAVQPGPTRMSSVMSMSNVNANSNIIYDSHQPKRQNTIDSVRQSNMLTQWRASLQQGSQANHLSAADELARQQMIEGRRQAEYLEQKQQAEKARRESAADMAMRQGFLHEAHRDAMRKMQAKANRKAEQ
ncbi:hypothetical protein Tdes44962_MAKER04708 [Teratosphaeria destructans]|uniref:Uncharacterized protein n=1 Tax=Teratosphaeria destructans TaxID=418781 RepID=A0A9W7SLN4_9PEZI|nr:hypothetical protein Tdes44962_MAKER04708 [Teratosphaeria destructans]